MDKTNLINTKINHAFEKLAKTSNLPVNEIQIAIIGEQQRKIYFAAYHNYKMLKEIKITDVMDFSFLGFNVVSEKQVFESILNKFNIFAIPLETDLWNLRVLMYPNKAEPEAYLFLKDKQVNKKPFKVALLF